MQLLGSRRQRAPERPLALDALIDRYDASVIDLIEAPARIRLAADDGEWDVLLAGETATLTELGGEPDALISASDEAWRRLALDIRAGQAAFDRGGLEIRRNLHLGVGFLAATSGSAEPGRTRFASYETSVGRISTVEAGQGEPLICLPGLGGTKASFTSTLSHLAEERRVIAIDLPGFGDSAKPLGGDYDAAWFASVVVELLDALGLERADLIGNSMGGRVSIEVGLRSPERVRRIVLLSPAMAWLHRDPVLEWLLRLPLPRLGLLQPTPRALIEPLVHRLVPGETSGWMAAGIDEFLRAFCSAPGRYAFYESARNIYRDEPNGEHGFWSRLAALSPETMFVWGRQDTLVPIAFMKHVERVLPAARHVELDCGHVPQVEEPVATHRSVSEFLAA